MYANCILRIQSHQSIGPGLNITSEQRTSAEAPSSGTGAAQADAEIADRQAGKKTRHLSERAEQKHRVHSLQPKRRHQQDRRMLSLEVRAALRKPEAAGDMPRTVSRIEHNMCCAHHLRGPQRVSAACWPFPAPFPCRNPEKRPR